jgi:hypothetical protein
MRGRNNREKIKKSLTGILEHTYGGVVADQSDLLVNFPK